MFAQWYEGQRAQSESWLHDLHRHPETGFEELRTAAFVADRLREFGIDVTTGIGGTGVVGTLRGCGASGRCVAFRAELDALPMTERTGLAYASDDSKRFHGCGHDGHTVTALTAAAYLARRRDFDGIVRFIFQPEQCPAASSLGGFPTRVVVAPVCSVPTRPTSENLHLSGPSASA
ncbi:hypothetical protein DKT77_11520 [Meridianimarinicoccus roseus]|uniref:Amidohydrolase n=1 Tax=Meridianimarinicoccus roseus TaxID=2072018 RepID=A0A2V2LB25_9RHOB|nr:M20/M25/M40 family metallo-hydrolase [Meridianimarinicoccus roseus]PWR02465.1 hypothetical protein DKT77_11520 [Meridianimarinicoccus roseus]